MDKGLEIAEETVGETDKKVKRVYWTNKEIENYFAKRSAKEIINSGNTCFMNPCGDLTLVSSYLLEKDKIPHRWVIEEHPKTKSFNFNRLHFALEFNYNGSLYVINHKGKNNSYIYRGTYNGHEKIPSNRISKIPNNKINLNKSLYENLINKDLENIVENFSLEKNINKLKEDNSLENYEDFINKYGKKIKINKL